MKRFLYFILLTGLPTWLMAQQYIHAKVVDAEDGEPLAYAQIYASPGKRALTNEEGNFTIHAAPDDSIKISIIGYETVCLCVADLKAVIPLTPLSTLMKEVTVTTTENILNKAAQRMKEAYKNGREKRSTYFCRTIQQVYTRQELLEAFIEAESSMLLQDLTLLTGKRMRLGNPVSTRPTLANTNLHHMLELGPMLKDATFWLDIEAPLDKKNYKKYYTGWHEVQYSKDGQQLYVVHLERKRMIGEKKVLEGTLYVDANTFDLKRFEGKTPPMRIYITAKNQLRTVDVRADFRIDYSLQKGMLGIESYSYTLKGNQFLGKSILFNVDGVVPETERKRKKMGENMAREIDQAGYDAALWQHSSIIQRTQAEEKFFEAP